MIAKPKHQRLVLVIIASLALIAAALLAMWGLQDRAAYFYTPTEIVSGKAAVGKPSRLGGMVQRGSVTRDSDGLTTSFLVTDGQNSVVVSYRGILPDLFREDSGVVAEGRLAPPDHFGQIFVADNILAKHDERYMPPELGNQAAGRKAAETVDK